MSNRQYPYIQNIREFETVQVKCDRCKIEKYGVSRVEWRVDWFQGNCEFENICKMCLSIYKKKKAKEDETRMKKEARQAEAHRRNQRHLIAYLGNHGISVECHTLTGQWVLNGVMDWWTTTDTAIHRKTRDRYTLSIKRPEEIVSVMKKYE